MHVLTWIKKPKKGQPTWKITGGMVILDRNDEGFESGVRRAFQMGDIFKE
jgi:hypothetical protein